MPFTILAILTLKIAVGECGDFFILKREVTIKLLPLARKGAKFKNMRVNL